MLLCRNMRREIISDVKAEMEKKGEREKGENMKQTNPKKLINGVRRYPESTLPFLTGEEAEPSCVRKAEGFQQRPL